MSRSRSRTPQRDRSRSRSRHSRRSRSRHSPSRSPSPCPPPPKDLPSSAREGNDESSDDDDVLASRASVKPATGSNNASSEQKPISIKEKAKEEKQSFLAMLEEKKKKSKMIPIVIASTKPSEDDASESSKNRGFVSTFQSLGNKLKSKADDTESNNAVDENKKSARVEDGEDREKSDGRDERLSPSRLERSKAEADRSLTARELIERKKQRNVDGVSYGNNNNGTFDPTSMIGKMQKAKKTFVRRKATQSDGPNLSNDYAWYQQYYETMYGLSKNDAAYSAYYTMVTGGDYSQSDLSAWAQLFGYAQPTYSSLYDSAAITAVAPVDAATNTAANDQSGVSSEPSKSADAELAATPQNISIVVDSVPSAAKDVSTATLSLKLKN